jgi:hypothetical protein
MFKNQNTPPPPKGRGKARGDSNIGQCDFGHGLVIGPPARGIALRDQGRRLEFGCCLLSSSRGLWLDRFLDNLVLDSV